MELKKTYTGVDDENDTNLIQVMCILVSDDSEQYSGIWDDLNNITLLGTENYKKTTTAVYEPFCRNNNPSA